MADTVLTAQAVADIVGGRLLGKGDTRLSRIGPLDRKELAAVIARDAE